MCLCTLFQKSLKRCGLCHGPLVEVLESREVSYYANAEFHSIEDKKLKNSITVQVREPLLHDLGPSIDDVTQFLILIFGPSLPLVSHFTKKAYGIMSTLADPPSSLSG